MQPKVNTKLRQLNWAKIPDPKTLDTIWGKGGATDDHVKLDQSEIEALFAVAEKKPAAKSKGIISFTQTFVAFFKIIIIIYSLALSRRRSRRSREKEHLGSRSQACTKYLYLESSKR